jgi:hypothetical protein
MYSMWGSPMSRGKRAEMMSDELGGGNHERHGNEARGNGPEGVHRRGRGGAGAGSVFHEAAVRDLSTEATPISLRDGTKVAREMFANNLNFPTLIFLARQLALFTTW